MKREINKNVSYFISVFFRALGLINFIGKIHYMDFYKHDKYHKQINDKSAP